MLGKNKKDFVFNILDEVSLWKRFKDSEDDFEVLANEVSSRAVIGSVRIEGPVELLVSGDDEMSLVMPVCFLHLVAFVFIRVFINIVGLLVFLAVNCDCIKCRFT